MTVYDYIVFEVWKEFYMSKFSARKPLTVFAAVIVVIILGIVSLTNMTPDLLPNMDMPYVVVMTSYPGATPEEVETTVTQPVEQRMASLEHIKTIQSTSSANYSMIVMEFNPAVNMDTISVDILQEISRVSGRWEDSVGAPVILKINPSMMPVMVAAVDKDGMDTVALSAFVSETLMPQLQGIPGVASVSANGILNQTIKISLNADMIDAQSDKVARAINAELADAKQELDEAQDKLDDGRSKIKSGKSELEKAQESTFGELAGASQMINEAVAQSIAYNAQLSGLGASKSALEAEKSIYKGALADMSKGAAEIDAGLAEISSMRTMLGNLLEATEGELDSKLLSELPTLDPVLLAVLAEQGCTTLGDVRALDATLATQQTTLEAQKAALIAQQAAANTRISQIDTELANLATKISVTESIVKQIDAAVGEARQNYTAVEAGKLKAAVGFGAGSAQLAAAETNLESAEESLKSAIEQYEDGVKQALKAANLDKTITLDTISAILTAQNFSMPAGYVYEEGIAYLVSVGDKIMSVEEFESLMLFDLGIEGTTPIYLTDVADIELTDNSDSVYTMINGNAGVALTFSKQSSYATAQVSDSINAKFAELSGQHEGLRFTNLMDQGKYIYMVTGSITNSLLWGALFAVLILFLFLKDIRPTFITLCSIPISVIFAIVLMYFSGVSLNIMSLSGLAIAIGMLVDNSIVVIENTFRLRMLGESPIKAAVSGAAQVGGAIVASTLTTICVFVPVVFVEGITRQLFSDLALTMAYALIASLIIALTLVPAMSAKLLKNPKASHNRLTGRLTGVYKRSVTWTLAHKALILIVAVVLLISSTALALSKGFSFMPDTSSTQLRVTMEVPDGTSFEETVALTNEVADRLSAIEEIESVGAILSQENAMSFFASNDAAVSMYVLLDENAQRSSADISAEILSLTADMDCVIKADDSSTMSGYSEMLGGSGITVNVYGNDLDELQQAATAIAAEFEAMGGVQEVNDGMEETESEIHFVVDKEKAMKQGLTVAQVYMEIASALKNEKDAGTIVIENTDHNVLIVRGTDDDLTPDYIKNHTFTVTNAKGEENEVSIGDITTVEDKQTLSSIARTDQRRYLSVTATIAEGYNVTHVTADAQSRLSQLTLPGGVSYEFSGENESIMESVGDLGFMILVGILLVYLIMVAQFQSLKSPFIVIFTIPLAFTGGFLSLIVCGLEVSVIALVGFVMLSGVIVNNGIVLVDYINRLRAEGKPRREAIVEACITRMRPILMTSITTILGLSVMALGLSEGSAIMQPMAIVCIGGLIYATLMTLFVVPSIYDMMNKKDIRVVAAEDLELSAK